MTIDERANVEAALAITGSESSPISVSDAYTAMEFYLSADSTEDFFQLSSTSLAHLYFVKVQCQCKSVEYDKMNTDEKRTWSKAQMKKIQNLTKAKMIDALVTAVRVLYFIRVLQLTLSHRGKTMGSPMTFIRSATQTRNVFPKQRMQIPTAARPGFSVV